MFFVFSLVLNLLACTPETCTYAGDCASSGGDVLQCGEGDTPTFVAKSSTGEEVFSTEDRGAMEDFCCGDSFSFCEGRAGGDTGDSGRNFN